MSLFFGGAAGGGGEGEYWVGSKVSELSAPLICNPAELLGIPFALTTISFVATNLTPCL